MLRILRYLALNANIGQLFGILVSLNGKCNDENK